MALGRQKTCSVDVDDDDEDNIFKADTVVLRQRNRGEKLASNYKLKKPRVKRQDSSSLAAENYAKKKDNETVSDTNCSTAVNNDTLASSVVENDSSANIGAALASSESTEISHRKAEKPNLDVYRFSKTTRVVATTEETDHHLTQSDTLNHSTVACDVCKASLDQLSEAARLQHVNQCLDKRQSDSDETFAKQIQAAERAAGVARPSTAAVSGNLSSVTSQCFICKKVIGQKSSITHLKKCAAKYNISTADLLKMREESLKNSNKQQLQPAAVQSNSRRHKRGPRIPRSKLDEDMQLALALSASTFEQRRDALDLLKLQPQRGGTSLRTTADNKVKAMEVTALTATDDEARASILHARVASLLQHEPDIMSHPASRRDVSPVIADKYCSIPDNNEKSSLWQLSGARCSCPQQTFYVAELSPLVVVDTVAVGSKVCFPIRQQVALAASAKMAAALVPSSDSDSDDDDMPYTQTTMTLAQLAAANLTQVSSQRHVTSLSQSEYFTRRTPAVCESSGFLTNEQQDKVSCDTSSRSSTTMINNLQQGLLSMVDNCHGADVHLCVAHGDTVHAHSFILDLRCPLLLKDATMLEQSSKSAVLSVMKYVYGAVVQVESTLCREVVSLACRLKLAELAAECKQRLSNADSYEQTAASEKSVESAESSSGGSRRRANLQKLLTDVWSADSDSSSDADGDGGDDEEEEEEGAAELDAELYEYMATQRQGRRRDAAAAADDDEETGTGEAVVMDSDVGGVTTTASVQDNGTIVHDTSCTAAEPVAFNDIWPNESVRKEGNHNAIQTEPAGTGQASVACEEQAAEGVVDSEGRAATCDITDDDIIDLDLGATTDTDIGYKLSSVDCNQAMAVGHLPANLRSTAPAESPHSVCCSSQQVTLPRSSRSSRGRASASPDLFSPVNSSVLVGEGNDCRSQRKRAFLADTPASSTAVKKRRSEVHLMTGDRHDPTPEYVDLTQCTNDLDCDDDLYSNHHGDIAQRDFNLQGQGHSFVVNWDDEDDLPDIVPCGESLPSGSSNKNIEVVHDVARTAASPPQLLSSCNHGNDDFGSPLFSQRLTTTLPKLSTNDDATDDCTTTPRAVTSAPSSTSRPARCSRRLSAAVSTIADDEDAGAGNISFPDIPAWDDISYSPITMPHSTPAAAASRVNGSFDPPSDSEGESSDGEVRVAADVNSPTDSIVSVTGGASVTDEANVTVYPHYSLMETPRVQVACQKVGVKTKLPKKKMVTILKHIYCEQHGGAEACPVAAKPVEKVKSKQSRKKMAADATATTVSAVTALSSGSTIAKSKATSVKQSKKRVTAATAAATAQPLESATEDDEDAMYNTGKRVVMEESILECHECDSDPGGDDELGDTQKRATTSRRNDADANRKMVCDYIRSRPDLYLKVLHYETIDFEWIKQELACAGHHISTAQLTDVLDSQGILFSFRQSSDKARFIPTAGKRRRRAK